MILGSKPFQMQWQLAQQCALPKDSFVNQWNDVIYYYI